MLGEVGQGEHLLKADAYRKDLGLSLLKLDYCFLLVQPVVWLNDNRAGGQTATVGEDLSRPVNLLH